MGIDYSSAAVRRFRWLPIAIGGITVAVYWVAILVEPRGDFPRHWELGRRLLAGEYIYENGLNFVYPPFWALVHAPLALLTVHRAQIIGYALAPLSLTALVWLLDQLSRENLPLDADGVFWSTTFAIFLNVNFITRDFPEIGVNAALVSLSWLAIYLWTRGREVAAGISLGAAAALKCTPLLFVAYFALKREWKMVFTSSAAFALFTVAPLLVQGPQQYFRAMNAWTSAIVRGVTDADPSRGPLGEEKVENIALRPALARYLMHLPYGHLGRPETSDTPGRPNEPPNPYYLQFLDLPPARAAMVAGFIMGGFLLIVGGLLQSRVTDRRDIAILYECAAVSLLILLYSPITWKQHCVGALPAVFLICREGFAGRPIKRWVIAAVLIYAVFTEVLSREIVGRDVVKLADSYRVKTIAIVTLTAAVLGCRRVWLRQRQAAYLA